MTSDEFVNACNIMRSLDVNELDDGEYAPSLTWWKHWERDPIGAFIVADDERRDWVWKAVERRMGKKV